MLLFHDMPCLARRKVNMADHFPNGFLFMMPSLRQPIELHQEGSHVKVNLCEI